MSKLAPTSTTFNHPEGYVIRLPLPERHGFRQLRRVQVRALKREISGALNAGYAVRDPLTSKPIQIYRHAIFRAQVTALSRLQEITDEMGVTYVHVKRFTSRKDGAFAKLILWDLVEPLKPASRYDREACDGKWKITTRGRQFLAGTLRVPRQVAVLLGVRIGYVDERDTIIVGDVPDAFDKKAHTSSDAAAVA